MADQVGVEEAVNGELPTLSHSHMFCLHTTAHSALMHQQMWRMSFRHGACHLGWMVLVGQWMSHERMLLPPLVSQL